MTEIVLKPEIKIRLVTAGGRVWAIAHTITAAGPVTFCASVDLRAIQRAVSAYLQKKRGASVETAGFFDGVKKLAKKVASGKALKKVLDQVEEIRRNPYVAKAVGLATVVVPGAGAAVAAYDTAQSTIKALEAKDPNVVAKVQKLAKLAQAGHPPAAKAMRVLQIVRQHGKAQAALLDPNAREALVVAYSRELRTSLPPTLLRMVGPALEDALRKSAINTSGVAVGWEPTGRPLVEGMVAAAALGRPASTGWDLAL
jgi:hypothetical protein